MPPTILLHPPGPVPVRKTISAFLGQVIHGDCVEVMATIPSESVDLVVTDPPYLVSYRSRDGRRCENDDNAEWVEPAFREIFRVLKPNRFCATFYGWPWVDKFMAAWKQSGFRPVSHFTWVKPHTSYVGYTAGHHEVGYLLAKGKPPKPKVPLSDVLPWKYTGNKFHPNEKPVMAIQPLIETYSAAGEIVLDPFAGSGTAAVAALACRRCFILIEKEERYWQAAWQRIKKSASPAGPDAT
jgi:site-specific DNA-methyltransferase (adenine-specific)